ncbi:hypothetical protein CDL12_24390 [Handroanthus impetiginosus]|uniref:Bifunctional inhibitor/plant lipid transfer protein/seed storage helical domain-containing protein n=1 Tax=Handroanthus impetiginosus TaxID=429701 RepID=A0A2G9GDL1_9LAMI|nr:hypothetical protein CDL12_24390 [Handroanthus impetiginosus]
MGSRTSRKGSLFLTMNLLCYILATTACNSCSGPSTPGLTPSRGGRGSGGGGGGGDALRLGVCANLLGGLVGVVIGNPPTTPCCTLIAGLVDLEAAVCLCTAIRANVLGIINLNVRLALTLLLNVCGRTPPPGFTCP